ncbi:MAG TPA: transglycosylase domain-containing protein [Propioniciclava sp.]|uniref:transglycosylase domain-containing protein n=1 Tax=Propioniciclava sp. TaxID=2038686 RepID=UPI002CB9847E|nr:transglycosylase domain-containing protein [Propioniciclava sp.]HRL80309.1 transglycosylase domain-containing protein [Propioniciclava sp.]
MTNHSQGTAPRASRSTGRKRRTPGRIVLSILKWIVILIIALAVIGAGVFGVLYARQGIPNPNTDFETNLTSVYYADGQEQMSTFAVQNRVSIPLSEMPETAKQAVVAGENETFWDDPGISIPGLMRAAASLVGPGDAVGGSTITQQYVKVMYLTQDKTFTRKLTEILVALKIGQELSKEDILERYLNAVYFGRGAYGIQAASQAYFGIDAKDLDLAQSVALTAIINSPNNLDPGRGEAQRSDLMERYQYVLNQMVKLKYITEDQRAELYTTLPDFPTLDSAESRWGGPKGHLLKLVQEELKAAGFDEAQIQGGGLRITTTIDKRLQDAAVAAAQDQAARIAKAQNQDPNYYHPAIASIDTGTGAILAMYGGPDYTSDFTNYAVTPRAAGSTFKPWALVAGLRDGASLTDRFNGDTFTLKGESKPITNGGHNYGPVTLEKATTSSINTAYVDLVTQMKDGPQKVIQAALDAGLVNNKWQATPNIPLGSAEVSPLEAARGFATLANEGKRTTPHIIAQVTDMNGQVVYSPTINPEQTIENDVSTNAVNALLGVTQDGTGRVAVSGLNYEVAGKTGTNFSNGETLATWFVGATRQISTAFVLTAGPQALSNLGRNTYGSTYSAVGWNAYMKVAMAGKERIDFPAAVKQTRKGNFTAPPTPTPTATPTATASVRPTSAAPTTSEPTQSSEPTSEPTTAEPTARPTRTTSRPTTTPTARP